MCNSFQHVNINITMNILLNNTEKHNTNMNILLINNVKY